jgi:hypothetical protein
MKNRLRLFVTLICVIILGGCKVDPTTPIVVGGNATLSISLEQTRTSLGDKVGDNYPKGLFLYPGTEMMRVGGGVEYYPLGGRGNRDVRLHAVYAYNFGNNTNPAGTAVDKGSYLTVGLTWRIDIMAAARKIINKCR